MSNGLLNIVRDGHVCLPGYPIMLFSVDAREAGLGQDGRFLHIELHDLESSLGPLGTDG